MCYSILNAALLMMLAAPVAGQELSAPPTAELRQSTAEHRALARRMVDAAFFGRVARAWEPDRAAVEAALGQLDPLPELTEAERARMDELWEQGWNRLRPQAYLLVAPIYERTYTETQLREIVPFFESAAGQAYVRHANPGRDLGFPDSERLDSPPTEPALDETQLVLTRRLSEAIDKPIMRAAISQLRANSLGESEAERERTGEIIAEAERDMVANAMALARRYARVLSIKEMQEILAFFERPIGRVYIDGSVRTMWELGDAISKLDIQWMEAYDQFCLETGKYCTVPRAK